MPLTRNGSSSRKSTNTGASESAPTAIRLGQSTRYSPRNDCIPTVSIQRSGSLTSVRAKTKSDQVTIARYVAHAASPGRASGSTTYHTACAPLQPSSIAANSISRGMPSKNPFMSHVANGTPTAALASTSPSRWLIRPKVEKPMKKGMTIRLAGSILDKSSANPALC